MPQRPTDFYLNLDRWEHLSAIERHRGAWQARFEGPASRTDPIRQQAVFLAAWSLFLPEKALDAKTRDLVLGPIPPNDEKAPLLRAWRYCRAVRFVEGWHQAFQWTTAGVEQIARLLLDPTERLEEGTSARLVAAHQEADILAKDVGGIPVFYIAAFYGHIWSIDDINSTYYYLYMILLRLYLLQRGYPQVLAAPIEIKLSQRSKDGPAIGAQRQSQPSQPEAMLGVWLDEVTDLLLDVGSRAQDAWDRAKSLESRTALQETILRLAIQHGRVTAGDVLRATGANRNTVKDNLSRLVEEGSLLKHGQKRGTIYVPA